MPTLEIGSLALTPQKVLEGFHHHYSLKLHPEGKKRILKSREIVESQTKPAYGINTGVGPLRNQKINPQDLTKLSQNILRSHACGSGKPLPGVLSRLMLLLRIHTLALGFSGVRLELIEKLME